MERIRGLESALRQRDSSLQKLNLQLHSKDMQYLQLHAGPDAHSESPSQSPPRGSPRHAAARPPGGGLLKVQWGCGHPTLEARITRRLWRLQASFTVILTGLDDRKRISSAVIRSDVIAYARRISFSISYYLRWFNLSEAALVLVLSQPSLDVPFPALGVDD